MKRASMMTLPSVRPSPYPSPPVPLSSITRRASTQLLLDDRAGVRRISRKNNDCVSLKTDLYLMCNSCRENEDAKLGRSSFLKRDCNLPWILPPNTTCTQITNKFRLCKKHPVLFGDFEEEEEEEEGDGVKLFAKYWKVDSDEDDDDDSVYPS